MLESVPPTTLITYVKTPYKAGELDAQSPKTSHMPRPKTKTAVTTVRLPPEVRDLWEQCAEEERRSLTSMLEVMVRAYAKRIGVKSSPALPQSPEHQA